MSPNPLDLFNNPTSEANKKGSSTFFRPSSPIEETVQIKELQLQQQHESLLSLRNKLKNEIVSLEREWSELHQVVQDDSIQQQKEENDFIFKLLLESVNELKSEKDGSDLDEDINTVEDPDLVEFKPQEFSSGPIKDWEVRLEFLRKFYPYLQLENVLSRVSLEYNDENKPKLVKIISFELKYGKLFMFDIKIKLMNQSNEYSIIDLSLTKLSNNKFNSLLIQIMEHYKTTKNINEFLFTINDLYENLITRLEFFKELSQEYQELESPQSDTTSQLPAPNFMTCNHFKFKDMNINWDFKFNNHTGKVENVILINEEYNGLFQDMMSLYGLKESIRKLIREVHETTT